MNAMCMFTYLFIVYFLFAPVILPSIHRYVNYSDIQVLMMVTETETFNVDFTIIINSPIWIMFFYYLHNVIYINSYF